MEISPVKFCALTALNLFNNSIDNIESLTFLNAPNLKKVNLICNIIRSLDPLAKCGFKLENLWIYSYDIDTKVDKMSRLNTSLIEFGL